MADRDRERLIKYLLRPNAINAFEKFKEALSTGNNRIIEKSMAVRLLDEILSDKDCPFAKTLQQNTILYRSRPVDFLQEPNGIDILVEDDKEKYVGYDSYSSKEPPLGSQHSARCSIEGMPYLYAAEDEYTACAEQKIASLGIVSLASFIIKKDLHIIDFSTDVKIANKWVDLQENYRLAPSSMMTLVMSGFSKPISNNDNYTTTQYITDRIRKSGFDGIAYQSYFSTKKNYAIFNCSDNNVGFLHSHLVQVENKGYKVTTLSDDRNIQGKPVAQTADSIKALVRGYIEDMKARR